LLTLRPNSAAVNNQTNEGVAIKKVTNVFSKKILAKRALREIKLLQHFRGHRNVRHPKSHLRPRYKTHVEEND
jgi:serine/threonine protein kinase